ncbi:MAG: HupE/UreJ family protein [Bauldia sp.]|nr:HupE/UreJ family protein [Bauldia sp.]
MAALAVQTAVGAALLAPIAAHAHEVPDETTVFAFVKPEGNKLTLLVRAPMNAIRDVDGIVTREDGTLDLTQIEQPLQDGAQLWIRDFVKLYENGQQLATPRFLNARVSTFSDRSFTTFEEAYNHITTTDLDPATVLRWEQGLLDVAYEYDIGSENSDFAIEPGLTRLGVQVNITMRYVSPTGPERTYDVHAYVGRITLDPNFVQTAGYFAKEGFFHVLRSLETLIFLVAMVMPFRRSPPVLLLGAAFAAGSTITLIATAYGLAPNTLWFPYFVAFMVPVGILFMAVENIIGWRIDKRLVPAFCFGLVFGFAFSFVLGERMQFAGAHFLTAVIAFDIGTIIAALVSIAVAFSGLALVLKYLAPDRLGTILLSAFVVHTSWHWTLERGATLGRFPLPTLYDLMASGVVWWLTAVLGLAAVLWMVSGMVPRLPGSGQTPAAAPAPRES